jgi:hypothetical protein
MWRKQQLFIIKTKQYNKLEKFIHPLKLKQFN